MFDWPKALIPELAERRCTLVIGAGVSASCVDEKGERPRTWSELLRLLADLVSDASARAEGLALLDKERFLDAAQIFVDAVPTPDFVAFIRREFQQRSFSPSKLVKSLVALDPKVVVTTNYDRIYEAYCESLQQHDKPAYVVRRYYDDGILDEVRSTTRLLLKAHGCATEPQKIVLSRGQYFEARNRYGPFFKILDSVFLTNTLLFIGSSLSDPDVQLLLENANIAARSSFPHYAVVESGRHPALRRVVRSTYNIELLEYEAGRHELVTDAVAALVDDVEAFRAGH